MQSHVTKKQLTYTFQKIRAKYKKDPYPNFTQRTKLLKTLKKILIENQQILYDALKKDYGYRSEFDSLLLDLLPTISSINYTIKQLKKWMKPSKRHAGLMLFPSRVSVHYQPLGVIGIITPWNCPIFLALGPAIQALAAGNRVLIKMSEFTPHSNQVLRRLLNDVSDHIEIIEGDATIATIFSTLPFDHLLFTGSKKIGKLVAQNAAKHLTPLTLELGGKSPAIIDQSINMKIAVDALILGKAVNAGQICVSPDYILLPKNREQAFLDLFISRFKQYYLSDKKNNTYSHIINDKQRNRLQHYLNDAKAKGAIIHPVINNPSHQPRCLYPHILTNVTTDMLVMNEEIFGALLCLKTYNHISEAINYINSQPRPLALYIMSKKKSLINTLIKETHSGGVCINDTLAHVAVNDAPFGGIGDSGSGHYHGYEGFLTFSKAKTVLTSSSFFPKNELILKNRDLIFHGLKKFFLR